MASPKSVKEKLEEWAQPQIKMSKFSAQRNQQLDPLIREHQEKTAPIIKQFDEKINPLRRQSG